MADPRRLIRRFPAGAFLLPQIPAGRQHLSQHLAGGKAADTALQRRGAEPAAHPAAHLGGNAKAVPVMIVHQDAFHAVPVPQAEKELHRPVQPADPVQPDLRRQGDRLLLQLFPKRGGKIGHFVKIHSPVNPPEDLLSPEGRKALFLCPGNQFLLRHARQFCLHTFSFRRIRQR